MKLEIITNKDTETIAVATSLAKVITPPAVLSLVGDLGAGKTTFTKGLGKAYEINEFITSPTFTILNEYNEGKTKLYHFDMYRLSSFEEAVETGFLEYFDLDTLEGITVVEWASNTPEILPKSYYQVTILKLDDEEKRKIIFEKVEQKWKYYQ